MSLMLGLSKKPEPGRRRHDHMEERGTRSMKGPRDTQRVSQEGEKALKN
jgi:hypothetical protein